MQKSLLFLFFLGAVLTARAEWVVVQHGGTATTVSHADVRRITFEGGNMVTLMANGTQQSVPISDIDKCLFSAPNRHAAGGRALRRRRDDPFGRSRRRNGGHRSRRHRGAAQQNHRRHGHAFARGVAEGRVCGENAKWNF